MQYINTVNLLECTSANSITGRCRECHLHGKQKFSKYTNCFPYNILNF